VIHLFFIIFFITLVTVVFANYYIGCRIFTVTKYFTHTENKIIPFAIGGLSLALLLAGFIHAFVPTGPWIKSALRVVSAVWMGFFVYLLLYFLLCDGILLSVKRFIDITPKSRACSFGAAVLVAVATVGFGYLNASNVRTTSYTVDISKETEPIRIALVSDIHLGAVGSEERLEELTESINKQNPHVVCIAGDIFDNDYSAIQDPEKAVKILKSIKSKYGVYACFGNHDAGSSVEQMKDFLKESNIRLLSDDYVNIDNRLVLAGRRDSRPIGEQGGKQRQSAADALKGSDVSLPVVVMDHNPANIGEYGRLADLVLCGHTHKGQIFPGSIITDLMYEVDYGYYRKDARNPHVIVSSGVGTWGLPVRVGTRSEVVLITLK